MRNFWIVWCLFWALVAYANDWPPLWAILFLGIAMLAYMTKPEDSNG